jgi:hypothetical protein
MPGKAGKVRRVAVPGAAFQECLYLDDLTTAGKNDRIAPTLREFRTQLT